MEGGEAHYALRIRILMLQRFFMGFGSKDTAVMRFVGQNAGDSGVRGQIVSKLEARVNPAQQF